jgi:hypothetical protein
MVIFLAALVATNVRGSVRAKKKVVVDARCPPVERSEGDESADAGEEGQRRKGRVHAMSSWLRRSNSFFDQADREAF